MPISTRPIADIARELGLAAEEWLPYGRDKAKVLLPALRARSAGPDGKLVVVSAITPTPAWNGKANPGGTGERKRRSKGVTKPIKAESSTRQARGPSGTADGGQWI